jgi:hypothetical protein
MIGIVYMQRASRLFSVFGVVAFLFVLVLLVQCLDSLQAEAQTGPSLVPLCDVLQTPDKFDKQAIQLRGNVRLAFEDFSLDSEACPNKRPGIWLAFGGDVATPTMSTANDTVRKPGFTPVIGGVPVSLTKDDNFERFFALISARHGHDPHYSGPLYNVTAALTGIFLAGNRKLVNGKIEFPGYGHMGFFYLFIITRVDAVDSAPPAHLSVSGTVTSADGRALIGVDVYSQTVNCCQPWVSQARSDDAGFFAIRNAGQVLTFLKAGYSPKSIVLETGRNDIGVTLESRLVDDWQIPACKETSPEHHFHGLPLSLSIPHGLHSEQVSPPPDPLFVIHRKPGYQLIRFFKSNASAPYGETASWLFGSERFTQRNVVDADGKQIGIDTRGQQGNKMFWRILAMPGLETVEFYVPSRETADLFDGIIDSACVEVH